MRVPDVSADATTSPAKRRRVSIGSSSLQPSPSLSKTRERELMRASQFFRRGYCRAGGLTTALASYGSELDYLLFPSAIGGRSESLLTVFFPTCSPPLSRNTANASAIRAPRMAPRVPIGALLSFITTPII